MLADDCVKLFWSISLQIWYFIFNWYTVCLILLKESAAPSCYRKNTLQFLRWQNEVYYLNYDATSRKVDDVLLKVVLGNRLGQLLHERNSQHLPIHDSHKYFIYFRCCCVEFSIKWICFPSFRRIGRSLFKMGSPLRIILYTINPWMQEF